jgi:hypothetical protein
MAAEHATALVDLLVAEVLDRRCVVLAEPADNIAEPGALRRVDGSSVYTVAATAVIIGSAWQCRPRGLLPNAYSPALGGVTSVLRDL